MSFCFRSSYQLEIDRQTEHLFPHFQPFTSVGVGRHCCSYVNYVQLAFLPVSLTFCRLFVCRLSLPRSHAVNLHPFICCPRCIVAYAFIAAAVDVTPGVDDIVGRGDAGR